MTPETVRLLQGLVDIEEDANSRHPSVIKFCPLEGCGHSLRVHDGNGCSVCECGR